MKDFRRQDGQGAQREGGFERREQSSDFRAPRRDFDNRGGFNKFKGNRDGSSSRGEVMHKATCSDCNKSCEVPFMPNGNKPVYCNDCFGKKKDSQSRGFEKREFSPRAPVAHESRLQAQPRDTRIDELKTQVDAINIKLDRMMKVLVEMNLEPKIVPAVKKIESKPVVKKAAVKAVVKSTVKPVVKKKK